MLVANKATVGSTPTHAIKTSKTGVQSETGDLGKLALGFWVGSLKDIWQHVLYAYHSPVVPVHLSTTQDAIKALYTGRVNTSSFQSILDG